MSKTFEAEIDGQLVQAVTVDGAAPYRQHCGDGGYVTNERAVCACGRVCECAGDLRCSRCQEKAAAESKERVRLAVAGGLEQRQLQARIRRASQKAFLSR